MNTSKILSATNVRVFALREKKAHAHVLKMGRNLRTQFFSIRFLRSTEQSLFVGVVVGKKVAREAVVRNKLRRRVREHLRRHAQHKEVAGGSVIVFPQKTTTSLTRGKFYQELEGALGKAGIFPQSR